MKLADALAIIREREAWELAEALDKWLEAQYEQDRCNGLTHDSDWHWDAGTRVPDYKIGD